MAAGLLRFLLIGIPCLVLAINELSDYQQEFYLENRHIKTSDPRGVTSLVVFLGQLVALVLLWDGVGS